MLALAACSSASGPFVAGPISINEFALNENSFEVVPSSSGPGPYWVRHAAANITYLPNSIASATNFDTLTSNAVTTDFAIYGRSNSGQGQIIVAMLNGALNAEIKRLGNTTPQATGSATYTGTYMAIYNNNTYASPGFYAAGHILGTSELNANFDQATISGAIRGRANTGGTGLADITLLPVSIVDGAFTTGGTTGGAFQLGSYTANNGNYTGLFTGPGGKEVVGLVRLQHNPNNGSLIGIYEEFGGFVAHSP